MNRLEEEQPLVFNTLKNMLERKRLPHAIIFYGDKSTSKKEMAIYLAKKVYADLYDTTVEDSLISHRIDDNSFSNVFDIEPDGMNIKKEQIELVLNESSKTSLEEGPKFFIFNNAEALNASSSNSLLKFIEEPQEDTYIIFIVENLSSVIPTIKSRCALFSFRTLNKEFLKERLDLLGVEPIISKILIEYTQNEDEIIKISKDEELLKVVDLVPDLFLEPFEKTGSLVIYLNDNYFILSDDYRLDIFLSLLSIYLKDILYYIEFQNENFVFHSQKGRIKQLSFLFTKEKVSSFVKRALEIKTNINVNINVHLNLDALLLDIEMSKNKK